MPPAMKLVLLATIGAALLSSQLIACEAPADKGESAASSQAKATLAPLAALPVLVVRQKQSGSGSSSSSSTSTSSGSSEKPDLFLIWLKPYESFIPSQVMDMINSNVRPQTEQVSNQVMSQVPGAEEYYSQLSGILSGIGGMGGLQSIMGSMGGGGGGDSGSNPFSSMLGRRR